MAQAEAHITNDTGVANARLLRFLYELDDDAAAGFFDGAHSTGQEGTEDARFWSYTPRVTVTSFLQDINAIASAPTAARDASDSGGAPISQNELRFLKEFLQAVTFYLLHICNFNIPPYWDIFPFPYYYLL